MRDNSDSELVVNYLLACQRIIADYQGDGRLKINKETRFRQIASRFNYSNCGIIQVDFNTDFVSREIWPWREYDELRQSVFPNLPEHAQCVNALAERYAVAKETLGKWLSSLTYDVTRSITPVDQDFIRERAGWLLNDAQLGPFVWKARFWLHGLILEGESYQLSEAIVIRRPQASDFEREEHSAFMLTGNLSSGPYPSAIAEYVFQCSPLEIESEPFFVEKQTETLLQILRLYKVGSIESLKLTCDANSYSYREKSFRSDLQNLPQVNSYLYTISDLDIEPLRRFIATLLDRIPSYMELFDPPKKPNILGIPLPRYIDCLVREASVEERIASAVTCIEGLYLSDDDKGDIAYKFAQRLALTMKHFGFDPKFVAKAAKTAYSIRSKFVHGIFVKDRDRRTAYQLCNEMVNYARISIILCLQLNNKDNENKSSFLKLLDHAMLSETDAQQLRDRIARESFVTHPSALPIHYFQLKESESKAMADPHPTASKIKIHKVEQGQGSVGCHPRGVQVFYKESTTLTGNPAREYVARLLQGQGYEVKDGNPVNGTPIQVLCVTQPNGQLMTKDVEGLLRSDTELEFTADTLPEGSVGSV